MHLTFSTGDCRVVKVAAPSMLPVESITGTLREWSLDA